MLRRLALAAACAGCGASIGAIENQGPDGGGQRDAPLAIDAPADARACTGGDKGMQGPDGSCFLLFTAPKNFAGAMAACAAVSSHLAVIHTMADDVFAEQFVGTLDTLIGLTDQVTENTFVWVDNTAVTFKNFRIGEPNNGNGQFEEDCVVIAGSKVDKGWDDKPCATIAGIAQTGDFAYLCQF
jgi:hypothetical protein